MQLEKTRCIAALEEPEAVPLAFSIASVLAKATSPFRGKSLHNPVRVLEF